MKAERPQTGSAAATFTIDPNSNRLTALTGAQPRTYAYDLAGHTTGYANRTFSYNNRGRVQSVTVGGTTTSYVYNALGQLIWKSGGGVTAQWVYDEAGHLVGEYDGVGGLIQETVWLDDAPVATLRPRTNGVDVYYVHTDHLNTPRKVSRPSDNRLRWRWDPDPFGNGAPLQNPQGLGGFVYNLRYPGQVYLAESGLNYNYFRNYDPRTGRYIQSDPIGLAGGINTYSYVGDNPLSWIDPLGLEVTAILNTSSNTLVIADLQTNESLVVNAFTGGHIDPRNGLIFSPGAGLELPAPKGTYYITDNPNYRSDHPDWFGLLRQDDRIDDYFDDNGQSRSGVRLHSGRQSFGCVTVNGMAAKKQWEGVLKLLGSTSTSMMPYIAGPHWWNDTLLIKNYGTLTIK